MQQFVYKTASPFQLESGEVLPNLELAYCTYGQIGQPVVWVCHALTANADVADWWANIFGPDRLLDPEKYFIICANNLGSCYGTSSAASLAPDGQPYGRRFPMVTIRDMVAAHDILRRHLQITNIHLLIGGSQGAQQAMEWAIAEPQLVQNMALLATNARHSPWGIAFNEAQRMALEAGGEMGLQAARAIAMLSYRNYEMYNRTAANDQPDLCDGFGASSYQRHQGAKLARRFDADSYYTLSKAMDSHNVGRGRGSCEAALRRIQARTFVIGISSDLLFPPQEQAFLAEHIPNGSFKCIDSPYGHDGFLTEGAIIDALLREWLAD